MLFGVIQEIPVLLVTGVVGGLILLFQMLQGLRVIKLKGRLHLKVHKAVAWAFVVVVLVHMAIGLNWAWQILG